MDPHRQERTRQSLMVLSLVESSKRLPLVWFTHLTCACRVQTSVESFTHVQNTKLSCTLRPLPSSVQIQTMAQLAYKNMARCLLPSICNLYLVYFLLNLQGLQVVKLRLVALELGRVAVLEWVEPRGRRGGRPRINGRRSLQATRHCLTSARLSPDALHTSQVSCRTCSLTGSPASVAWSSPSIQ